MDSMLIKLSFVLLICFSISCTNNQQGIDAPEKVQSKFDPVNDSCIQKIQTGDVLLRKGRDELSQLFSKLNRHNTQYSHCGLAVRTDTGVYVYHIISSANNPDGKILYEPIRSFIQPRINEAWAIVRYQLNVVQTSDLVHQIQGFAAADVVFDKQFDLNTDDKLYCSEMLYKALLSVTKDANLIKPTITNSGKKYIAIDNLFGHNRCKTIGEIAYK